MPVVTHARSFSNRSSSTLPSLSYFTTELLFRCWLFGTTVLALSLLTGCGDEFLSEEMHLGPEEKVRPIALIVEPAEAAPGEPVTLSLYWHSPDATEPNWRVALEFDEGLYGTDPLERRIRDLEELGEVFSPIDEGNGFWRQSVRFTLPDSIHLWSTSLDGLLSDDDLLAELAEDLPKDWLTTEEVGKEAIDAVLRSITPQELSGMGPEDQEFVRQLANLFSTQIRFRARFTHNAILDVTRTMTVRHSGRLSSSNTNGNPVVTRWAVVGVPEANANEDRFEELAGDAVRYPFLLKGSSFETMEHSGILGTGNAKSAIPEAVVPRQEGWTYYLTVEAQEEEYGSPLNPTGSFREQHNYRWYWLWTDDPRSDHALMRDDEGEETEMESLEENVRLAPPIGDGPFREIIQVVVRDERPEWERFGTSAAATLLTGRIVFE